MTSLETDSSNLKMIGLSSSLSLSSDAKEECSTAEKSSISIARAISRGGHGASSKAELSKKEEAVRKTHDKAEEEEEDEVVVEKPEVQKASKPFTSKPPSSTSSSSLKKRKSQAAISKEHNASDDHRPSDREDGFEAVASDDSAGLELDAREHELDAVLEQTGADPETYSGEWTDETLRARGFVDAVIIEDVELRRKPLPISTNRKSIKWSPDVLELVWSRGCIFTSKDVAVCYLCERALIKEKRTCECRKKSTCCCGAWEVEHVLAKHVDISGRHVLGNLLPACVACNSASWKGLLTLVELVQRKGLNPCEWAGDCQDLLTETLLDIRAANDLHDAKVNADAVATNADLRAQLVKQRALNNLDASMLVGIDPDQDWREIEAGGFGTVYETKLKRHQHDGTVNFVPVAVKQINTSTPRDELSFQREVLCLSQLQHPNVPKLYGSFMNEGGGFIVLELFTKPDLNKASQGPRKGHLPYASIFRDVAAALLHMKQVGYLHRDCKLGNILLGENFRAVLADFGESRLVAEIMSRKAGTAWYRAPEIHSGQYGHEVDVSGLGQSVKKVRSDRLTNAQIAEHGGWMDAVIKACTRKNRYQRPTMEQVHRLLKQIASGVEAVINWTEQRVATELATDASANQQADEEERKKRMQIKLEALALAQRRGADAEAAVMAPAPVAAAKAKTRRVASSAVNNSEMKVEYTPGKCQTVIRYGPRKGDTCGRSGQCRYHS